MRSTTLFIAALAIAAGRVVAQDDPTATDTNDIPECITTCTMQSASQAGCTSMEDLTCLCTSEKFQTLATECIVQQCPKEQWDDATAYQLKLCTTGDEPTESISSSASSAIASATSSIAAAASSAAVSASSSAHASASSVGSASILSSASAASASASNTGNAATAVKMPSASLALGATVLAFVVGPLLVFA
ncbi:hypothetical protein FRC00_003594 [Tulasnella sp. 408]|nr:hypothetical protein FRC00_003594 [Tulasnella sp. 408]